MIRSKSTNFSRCPEGNISDDLRIQYRIGINLGDIVIEDDDIFGDGVNIAARLEQLADPGGICISGTAYDHLKSKIDVGYESLGNQKVKNIEEPIRVYRVLVAPESVGKVIGNTNNATRNWRPLTLGASIAIFIGLIFVVSWLKP
jgi:adenylate cyclase